MAGRYGDFIAEFDWVVGRVLKALERNGLEEDTIVIVTSDNGANNAGSPMFHKANGPFRGMKGDIYEGGHRVPFIVRWPGRIEPGTESAETICLSDLMATAAEIVGYSLPDDAGEDSYNILPAIAGTPASTPIREATVHHSMVGMFGIRQGKWKYIEGRGNGTSSGDHWAAAVNSLATAPSRDPDTGDFRDVWFDVEGRVTPADSFPGQLYDLESDPAESVNLWQEHPEIVDRLGQLLDRYRRDGRSR
jgi:arylsulfatase A-like enzyme